MTAEKKTVSKKTNVLHILLTEILHQSTASPRVVGAVPALPSLLWGGGPSPVHPKAVQRFQGTPGRDRPGPSVEDVGPTAHAITHACICVYLAIFQNIIVMG